VTVSRLVLWRHGETNWNADRRMQGQLDAELSTVGVEQARRAAPHIAAFGPNALLTSDLRRAADTAAVLTEHTGLTAQADKRLRETHLGDWQGLTHQDVDTRWPGGRGLWRRDAEWAPPGGETRVEVAGRARQVVIELDARADVRVAVLCAHGGLIASLVACLLGLPVNRWPALGGIGNCHWAVLDRPVLPKPANRAPPDLPWRLNSYNAGVPG
jgi:glucosyl-3-phosphoglycerate phosphatase